MYFVPAFVRRGDLNLIVVDYSVLLTPKEGGNDYIEYAKAVRNVPIIGRTIGRYLKSFNSTIQSSKMFRLVGHSLGAHIMSYAAKEYGAGTLRLTGD